MAGLLDLFGNADDAQRAGLLMLAAAGPRAQPASFGQRLLESVQQFDAQKQAQKDRAAQEEERRIRQQLIQAQIGETQAQAAQRQAQAAEMQRKAEEAQRIQALVRDTVGQSVKPIQANQASGIAGPRPEALSVVGSRPPVDWQSLIAQGVPADLVKQLAEAPTLGRAKVARTAEVMGPNGPETVQLDEFGNRVGDGMAKPFELRMQDLGGKVAPINPYTGAVVGAGLGKTQTPDGAASNSLGWANYGLAKQRETREASAPKGQYDPERGLMIDPRTGQAQPVTMGGQAIGPKDKALTDAQSKALLFGSRMAEADKIIAGIEKSGTTMPGVVAMSAEGVPGWAGGGVARLLGNTLQTKNEQMLSQAQRDFVNAALRRESGAVISDAEAENARRQYFPQPGDSNEVKEQKARNRALAVRGVMAEVPENKRGSISPQQRNITVEW